MCARRRNRCRTPTAFLLSRRLLGATPAALRGDWLRLLNKKMSPMLRSAGALQWPRLPIWPAPSAGYPGRKNLLWISEEFPLGVGAQLQYEDVSRPTRFQLSDLPGSREAASLIASAQIAVYPISVLGLEAGGIGPESRGSALGGVLSQQFNSRQALRSMMESIADQTGGEAFVGMNDLAGAMRRSIEDGSNFYTLAYRPHNQTWNGQFRQIRVKLRVSGNSLSYRHGYFAFPNGPSPYSNTSELHAALQPESAESTMLLLKSKVQLPMQIIPLCVSDSILDAGNVAVTTGCAGTQTRATPG